MKRKPILKLFLSIIFTSLLILFPRPKKVLAECYLDFCHGTSGPSCRDACYWCNVQWCILDCGDETCCHYDCSSGSNPCGGGCFTPDTLINTPEGVKEIKDLKEGDKVESFNLGSEEKKNSIVEKIYETTRSSYYKIKTKDGKEIKVTAEHPLYTIQKDNASLNFLEYLKNESFIRRLLDRVLGE